MVKILNNLATGYGVILDENNHPNTTTIVPTKENSYEWFQNISKKQSRVPHENL